MTPQELTSKLKAIAKEKGISTYKMSELTGIAQPNIHRTLSGKNNPNIETLYNIAKALNYEIILSDLSGASQ